MLVSGRVYVSINHFFSHFFCLSLSRTLRLTALQAFSLACHRSSGPWQLRIPSDASGLQNYNHEKLATRISKSPSTYFFLGGIPWFIRNLNKKTHPTAVFFEFGHPEVLSWPEIWQWKVGLETQLHCWVVVFWMKKGWLYDNFMLKLH